MANLSLFNFLNARILDSESMNSITSTNDATSNTPGQYSSKIKVSFHHRNLKGTIKYVENLMQEIFYISQIQKITEKSKLKIITTLTYQHLKRFVKFCRGRRNMSYNGVKQLRHISRFGKWIFSESLRSPSFFSRRIKNRKV